MKTTLAFVGCGFVADLYIETIAKYPQLKVKGVFDRILQRTEHFGKFYKLHQYDSLQAIADDPEVDIVVNLTSPASHFEVSSFFLKSGKHVYSEKPLADNFAHGLELIKLAKSRNLYLAGAPCTIFSSTAKTMRDALNNNLIGKPRLIYAEMDDGPVDLMNCENWLSKSGTPWPYEQEFNTGCTLEHAGYYISWMLDFFGPAERVIAFSNILKPEKKSFNISTPDFSIGIIYFKNGVVARLTNGIYATHNHNFVVTGDKGSLMTDNCFHYYAPVYHEAFTKLNLKTQGHPFAKIPGVKTTLKAVGANKKRIKLVEPIPLMYKKRKHHIDFGVGINEMVKSMQANKPALLSGDFLAHINEIAFVLANAGVSGDIVELSTGF